MIRCLLIFAILGSCASSTPTNALTSVPLPTRPDLALTPGGVVPGCVPSTVGDRDVPESEKKDVLRAYGLPQSTPRSAIRFDHEIPHSACGSDGPENIWPEEKAASLAKDRFEDEYARLLKLDPSWLPAVQQCFRSAVWEHCGP